MEKASRSKFKIAAFTVALCGLVLSFGVPAKAPLIERNGILSPQCIVNNKEIDDLRTILSSSKPEIVLLGNSMVGEGVDQHLFGKLLNKISIKVWVGGGSSAWWYMVTKNVIAASEGKPQLMLIFFRDNFLTLPHYRTKGRYKKYIDNYATREEPVLDRILYFNGSNHFEHLLNSYVPFFRNSINYNNNLKYSLKDFSSHFTGIGDAADLDKAINSNFNEKLFTQRLVHLSQVKEDNFLEDKKNYQFIQEDTFLPHIIEICKENDIKLTFVCMKRLRDVEPNNQPEELVEYIEKLKKYLAENHIRLSD